MGKENKYAAKTYKNYHNIRDQTKGSTYNSRMDPKAPSANIATPPSQRMLTKEQFANITGLPEPQLTRDYDDYEQKYINYDNGATRENPMSFVHSRIQTHSRTRARARSRTRTRSRARSHKRTRTRSHRLR